MKKETRTKTFKLRMNEEEYDKLKYMSKKTNLTMSDVIRNGLSMYYNLINKY